MGTLVIERASGVRLELALDRGAEVPQIQPGDKVRLITPDGQSVRPQIVGGDVVIVLPATPDTPEETLVLQDSALYLAEEEAQLTIVDEASGEEVTFETAEDVLADIAPADGPPEPGPPETEASEGSALRPSAVRDGTDLDGRRGEEPDAELLAQLVQPEAVGRQAESTGTAVEADLSTGERRDSRPSESEQGDTGGGTPPITSVSGQAIDGYIVGATVFRDADGDGVHDAGEAFAITGANGEFTVTGGSGPLVMTGGIDISTNQFFKGTLTAPAGSTVITPLTTLMQGLIENGSATSVAEAEQQVKSAFSLSNDIDLTTFDPVVGVEDGTPGADAVMSAGIQLQNTIVQSAASLTGAAGPTVAISTAIDAVYAEVATSVKADPDANPIGTATQVEALINASATADSLGLDASARSQISAAAPDAATIIDDSNGTITNSTATGSLLLDALASVALVSQNKSATALFDAFDAVQGTGSAVDLTTAKNAFTSAGNLNSEITQAATEIGNAGSASPVGTAGNDTISGGAGNDVLDGLGGDDVITGAGGRDNLIGGTGNDSLTGDAGDDVLSGGTGNNILSGGAGIDVAQFIGRFDAHQITVSAGVITVSDSDSSDQVDTVETLKFDDLAVRIVGGNSSFASFADAQNAATPGDRILLIGSASTPATLSLSKRVTVETADGVAVSTASDGALVINGDAFSGSTTGLNLSALPGTTAVRFTSLGALSQITTASTQTLTLSVDQLDGLAVSGSGTLRLTGQSVPTDADLSGLSVNVDLPAGQSLGLTAAQADGLSMSGAGSVAVSALGGGSTDLSGITVTGSKSAAVPATATLALGTLLGGFTVDVAAAQTLTMTATQADGRSISGAGGVVVTGIAAGTDLSGVSVSGTLGATVTTSADISGNTTLGAVDAYTVSGTLTIAAAQADAIPIVGAGNVVLVGLGTDPVDLSQITSTGTKTANVSGNTTLDSGTDLGTFSLTVDSGRTLTLSAAQADGLTITGAGNVAITGLGTDQVDLSQITVAGNRSATVAGNAVLDPGTDLGGFEISLAGGQTLTLSAAQADGVTIAGSGNVTVTGLEAAPIDLSNISASGTLSAQVPLSATLASGTDLGGFGVSIASGQTLTLSAAQASGVPVTGTGNVLVTSLGSTLADLSQVTAGGTKTASVPASATLNAGTDLGTFSLVVSSGQTLTLSAAQADGHAISGNGNVAVTALGSDAVDLSQITAAGTKTANVPTTATLDAATALCNFDVTVASGQTLTLSAAQAHARTITGGSTVISGDVAANTDLTGVGSALGFGGGTIDVASGQTLTLTMAQATDKTVTGAGAVMVNGDVASGADLTGISAFLEFSDNTVAIASGQGLTLSATQASDVGITGSGTLLLSGVAPAAADYTGITADIAVPASTTLTLDTAQLAALDSAAKPIAGAGTVALSGDASTLGTISNHVTADLSVPSGETLVLTAAQANGLSLSGAGDVSITGLGDGLADLSGIATTGSILVTATGNPTLNAATDLGNATLNIPAGHTVTMSADQANGVTITGTGGSLIITGTISGATDVSQWQASTIDLTGATISATDLTLPHSSELHLTYAQANALNSITGTSGDNVLVIDVSGAPFDAGNEATIDFNISGLGGNDHVLFDFGAQAGNTIILSGTSTIDLGAGTMDRLESSNGTVNIAAATVTGVEELAINSTISMTAAQYAALGSDLSALQGAGEVLITVEADYNGSVDLSGLGFIPGGSTPPTVKIDAVANSGFVEGDIVAPVDTDTPVIILVRYSGQADFSTLGGFSPDRSYFAQETAVFTGEQFTALVDAIENDETGIGGSLASAVETIRLDGNIALATGSDLSTAKLEDVGINYNGYSIEITGGRTLTLTAAQADGGTIIGAGSFVITDLESAPSSLDLSGVAATDATLEVSSGALDLTSMSSLNLGDVGLTVTAPGSVTLTAIQANGIDAVGTGSMVVTGLGNGAVDFSGITVSGGFHSAIAGDLALNSLTDLGTMELRLAEGVTLSMRPAQIDGRTIGFDGSATSALLRFGGDVSGLDLGGIDSDLGFTVDGGRNLTLTAVQADGRDIGGAGNVYVTQLGNNAVDLSGITATGIKSANVPADATLNAGTDLDGFDLTVSSGATLTLTAAQADSLGVSGAGGVMVTALGNNAVDLSQVAVAGGKTVSITTNTELHADTDLQGFAVTVAAGQTLTLTAA